MDARVEARVEDVTTSEGGRQTIVVLRMCGMPPLRLGVPLEQREVWEAVKGRIVVLYVAPVAVR